MPTIKRVELINKKNFAKVVLDNDIGFRSLHEFSELKDNNNSLSSGNSFATH